VAQENRESKKALLEDITSSVFGSIDNTSLQEQDHVGRMKWRGLAKIVLKLLAQGSKQKPALI